VTPAPIVAGRLLALTEQWQAQEGRVELEVMPQRERSRSGTPAAAAQAGRAHECRSLGHWCVEFRTGAAVQSLR
jgi:hypothetical protein